MARDTYYDKFQKNKLSALKRFRHGAEYVFVVALRVFAGFWPVSVNQFFGRIIGYLGYLLALKDRGIARYQLGFCFPELTESQREKLLVQSFMNVGVTFFEALAIEKIRKKSTKWITLRNATVVREMMEEGRGLIMIFAHVGNWELFSIIYERLGIRGIAVESPNDGKKVRELLLSIRKSSNIKMVPRGDKSSARSILTCFRNNEVFLFAMDQDTKVRSIFVDFFGRKASTAVGAATFAQKFDAPVVAAFGARAEDGSHVYTFELLSRSPYTGGEEEAVRLTESYNRAIEAHIRKYPDQWVWFHRRWKNRPDDSDEGERAEEGV